MLNFKSPSRVRLDKFFQGRFPQYPKSLIKELIKKGTVTVNQRVIKKPHFVIFSGDQIDFDKTEWLKTRTQIIPNPVVKIDVIYQDEDVIVINKPAGLVVHPRQIKGDQPHPNDLEKTLVSGLLAYFPEISQVGDLPRIRPGIVHRLDKDTSGVMMVAKNQNAFEHLKNQFKKRLVKKKYLAWVFGQLEGSGIIKNFIARSKSNPTKQRIVASVGRSAILKYRVIKRVARFSLVEVELITGRTHQIRVQFSHIGYPIVGDRKYAPRAVSSLASRQLLHSFSLLVNLLSGRESVFQSSYPKDFLLFENELTKQASLNQTQIKVKNQKSKVKNENKRSKMKPNSKSQI